MFHAAFFAPASDLEHRVYRSLLLLALSAAICVVSGLLEREDAPDAANASLGATLPLQLFWWAAGVMVVLFVAAWYVESYSMLYRDIRPR